MCTGKGVTQTAQFNAMQKTEKHINQAQREDPISSNDEYYEICLGFGLSWLYGSTNTNKTLKEAIRSAKPSHK
jgi:hypothetical protein